MNREGAAPPSVRKPVPSAKQIKTAQKSLASGQLPLGPAQVKAQAAAKISAIRSARAAGHTPKVAVTWKARTRAAARTVQSVVRAARGVVAAIAAGGSIVLSIVVVLCLVGVLLASPLGILEGHLVEVTKDVYLTYYRVERHTKTLDEKDVRNGKVSYSDLDTEETLGEEMVPDPNAESVEDKAVGNILLQELRQCLAQLPLEEQNLIRALYFEELTEREYAKQINISQKAVNKRRHKILSKLRDLMKIK